MTYKRCIQVLLVLGVTLGLSACINYDQDLALKADGSGTMVMHYALSQQLVSMMNMGGGGDQSSESGKDMPFKLKEEDIRKDLQAPGVQVEKFETKTENDQQHFYVHIGFNKITDLNQTKTFREMPFEWIQQGNNIEFRQTLKGKEEKKADGSGNSQADQMGQEMAKAMFGNAAFRFNVKFPAKPTLPPGSTGKIAEDGVTVHWEYPLAELSSSDKVMAASFKAGGVPGGLLMYGVLGVAALVSLIGLIIVIIFARKA